MSKISKKYRQQHYVKENQKVSSAQVFKRSQSDALQEKAFVHVHDVPHFLKKAKLSNIEPG